MDEVADLQEASAVEYSTAKRCSIASLSNLLIFVWVHVMVQQAQVVDKRQSLQHVMKGEHVLAP